MATFPNAFKKILVGTGSLAPVNTPTKSLTAGQLALVDSTSHKAIDPAALAATMPKQAYLALGSYRTSDKIGQFHGGYKESIKTKGINPRYVTRFFKVNPTTARNQIVRVGWNGASDATSPAFVENQAYNLRLDLKGSPVLRFLGRNAYKVLNFHTGCAADPENPQIVDAGKVLIGWAREILRDPILTAFIKTTVEIKLADNSVVQLDTEAEFDSYTPAAAGSSNEAALILEVIYSDTVFGNDSFDRFDFIETEPVVITTAQLVDESGDPCSGFQQITFTETQSIRFVKGLGEQLIRDLILDARYRQEDFKEDARKRQIENDPTFGTVDRSKLYKHIFIQHSVPRFMNPSSTFDNDQYLIQLSFESSVDTTAIENFLKEFIKAGNTGVTLEDLS